MQSQKLVLSFIAAITLFIGGCNLFNPTESINIDSDDEKALTYEGYMQLQKNNYDEAEKYFKKALEADSTHSEAWYGLAKVLQSQQNINTFELLKYVNVGSGVSVPFYDMDDETAQRYLQSIGIMTDFLQKFIYKDTTNQLDGVITYKDVSNSYMILQMASTMLGLRSAAGNLSACNKSNPNINEECDLGKVLNSLKGNVGETLDGFHEMFSTCSDKPESMTSVADQYLQGFDLLSGKGQTLAVQTTCEALSTTTASGGDEKTKEKNLNIVIAQFGYSDATDDDGDGCVDEELYDGVDNDGDGEIDEDIRDKTNPIIYDTELAAKNSLSGKHGVSDLMIVKSAGPNEKYEEVDIDMDGIPGKKDDDEWTFIYADYKKRVANSDYRFKFAEKTPFNPQNLSYEEFINLKYAVAHDTDPHNIQYDLEFRKKYIGGCWINYDQDKFGQWFQGRN